VLRRIETNLASLASELETFHDAKISDAPTK
jgi:hypothetical protein